MDYMLLATEGFSFPLPLYFILGGIVSLMHHSFRGVAIADSVQGTIERTLLCVLAAYVLIWIESYL